MPAKKEEQKQDAAILTYKDKPLLRKGNQLYYGNPEDRYIVYMEIEESTELLGLKIGTQITVNLQTNAAPGREKVLKSAERDGLYKALDLGEYWLTEALEEA